MRLKRLDIIRMPGFEYGGFSLDEVSKGLNIIVGPNGSGKSTTCRALRGLLWPDELSDISYPELHSEWELDGRLLCISREGPVSRCQSGAEAVDRPRLPAEHLAPSYTITIDDLWAKQSENSEALAELIAREMRGGFNFQTAREDSRLKFSRTKAKAKAKKLQDIRRTLRSLQSEQRQLYSQKAEIDNLRSELKSLESIDRKLQQLSSAEQLIAQKRELAALKEQFSAYSPKLKLLTGNELELVREYKEQITRLKDECIRLESDLSELSSTKEHDSDSSRGSGGEKTPILEPSSISKLKHFQSLISRLEESISRRDEVIAKLTAEESFLAKTSPLMQEDSNQSEHETALKQDPAVTMEYIEQLESFRLRWERAEDRLNSILRERDLDSSHLSDADAAASENSNSPASGFGQLEHVLRAFADSSTAKKLRLLLALVLAGAAALCLAASVLALKLHSSYWLILLIPLASITAILCCFKREDFSSPAELSFKPEHILQEFLNHLSSSAQDRERRNQYQRLEIRYQAALSEKKQLDEEARRSLSEIDCGSTELKIKISQVIEQLRKRQAIEQQLQGEKAAREESRRQLEVALRGLNAVLEENGIAPFSDSSLALTQIQSICEASQEHKQRLEIRTLTKKNLAQSKERLREFEDKLKRIFAALDFDLSQEEELAGLLRQHPQYRSLDARCTQLSSEIESKEEMLLQEAGKSFLELDIEEISAQISEVRIAQAGRQVLAEKIGVIEGRIQQAAASQEIADALAEEEYAYRMLEMEFESAGQAIASSILLDGIEQEYQIERQPYVFKEACRLFEAFTRGRYTLAPVSDSASPNFHVEDSSGRTLDLSMLSRGTQTQLLLAVRVSFAANSERGEKLPIVLDEVLSNSDPYRFRAIAEALLYLVQQGRQIFYLSCQYADERIIRELAAEFENVDIKTFDLSYTIDRRNLGSPKSRIGLEHAHANGNSSLDSLPLGELGRHYRAEIEPADGLSMEEYSRLIRAPMLDPLKGADSAHLVHLLDDPKLLRRMLVLGVTSYGQLSRLLAKDGTCQLLTEDQKRKVCARAAVIDSFAAAARIGRGKKLTPEVISNAISSEVFRPRIIEQAEGFKWDSKALLEAIDPELGKSLKRFKKKSFESFRDKLYDSGYFDPSDVLDKEESRLQVLTDVQGLLSENIISTEEVGSLFEALWQRCQL